MPETDRNEGFLGLGWGFPPAFTDGGSGVSTVAGEHDVHESLRILLATRPGERVMRERFGCELSTAVFEEIDQSLLNRLKRTVSDAILDHEPRIQLNRLAVNSEQAAEGILRLHINYTIRSTNSRFNMVYPFYVKEASFPDL